MDERLIVLPAIARPTENLFIHESQNCGIKTVSAGAGRDDEEQHDRIKGLRQVQPIVDTVRPIDRLVEANPLSPGRSGGNDDDDKQPGRRERR